MQKNTNITNIYRIYTHDALFDSIYETINYLLLKYDATTDLQDIQGHNCFSQYDVAYGDILASKCFDNKYFQLVIVCGNEPEAHLQFYLHVASVVFNDFIEGSIEEEYGNDELFISPEHDNFIVYLFRKTQKKRTLLTLVQQSMLRLLILLYQGQLEYEDFYAYVFTVCYRPALFEALSVYVFANLFQLASDNFDSVFDEIYCILFTCIVLSDVNFVRVTSRDVNGGMVSIIFYFYSLYYMIVGNGNKTRCVVHRNKGSSCVETKESEVHYFGLHKKPYEGTSNNFLEIRHDYLVEQMMCKTTIMKCSCINLSIIKAAEYV